LHRRADHAANDNWRVCDGSPSLKHGQSLHAGLDAPGGTYRFWRVLLRLFEPKSGGWAINQGVSLL
jgi:hypothetical protein